MCCFLLDQRVTSITIFHNLSYSYSLLNSLSNNVVSESFISSPLPTRLSQKEFPSLQLSFSILISLVSSPSHVLHLLLPSFVSLARALLSVASSLPLLSYIFPFTSPLTCFPPFFAFVSLSLLLSPRPPLFSHHRIHYLNNSHKMNVLCSPLSSPPAPLLPYFFFVFFSCIMPEKNGLIILIHKSGDIIDLRNH